MKFPPEIKAEIGQGLRTKFGQGIDPDESPQQFACRIARMVAEDCAKTVHHATHWEMTDNTPGENAIRQRYGLDEQTGD